MPVKQFDMGFREHRDNDQSKGRNIIVDLEDRRGQRSSIRGSRRSILHEEMISVNSVDEGSLEGPIKPPPISLQLRDFYKLTCGIKTKFRFDRSSKPLNKSAESSFVANSSRFLLREQTTSEGSLMDTLIKKINNAVGPRDTFRSAIAEASKSWKQHAIELAVKDKIYREHEGLR